jgi:hypothetical protein
VTMLDADDAKRSWAPPGDMLWIPGGTFRMGSDKHYSEEAPVHDSARPGRLAIDFPIADRLLRQLRNLSCKLRRFYFVTMDLHVRESKDLAPTLGAP